MTILSVNVNKIAVLRNSRGGAVPDVLTAARACIAAGCGGITVHPRPDQRHIRPDDVVALTGSIPVELNIEGNPYAGPTARGYPGFLALVEAARPAQCTLVPDSDRQLTSDHGFDIPASVVRLRPVVERLKRWGCRVSVFVDAGCEGLPRLVEIGVDRIEIYTGPYAHAHAAGDAREVLAACRRTAEEALSLGLGVNAGHDLDQANLGAFLRAVPGVAEVSIGHALISEALYAGLGTTVRRYLDIIAGARRSV
jgi:pyridoxine 5-phosphate synthase